jgi:hypothetical protein
VDADDESIVAFDRFTDASRFLQAELRVDDLVLIKTNVLPDHLTRLALEWEGDVDCRRNYCSRNMNCDRCSLLTGRGPVKRLRRRLVRPWRVPPGLDRPSRPEGPSSAGTPAT